MSSTDSSTCSSSDNTSISSDDSNHKENLDLNGKILNKYNIINEIGRGADAIVWLAFNIKDNNYYAIKVNEPNEYKKGMEEINFIKKLPPHLLCFNHVKESFVEIVNKKKYACGVFELHTGNLDCIVRKGEFQNGLPIKIVKKIMYQLLTSLKYLHTKLKVYHADVKTDNILLKGYNNYDISVINQYNEFYKQEVNLARDKCHSINRNELHTIICEKIIYPDKEERYNINDEYIKRSFVSLSDFGAWCGEDEHYDTDFGTLYYRAPEIILLGETSYPVDIWASGCVLYELLTGRMLFDPPKDSERSRDDYHLHLIKMACGNFNFGFVKKTDNFKKFFTIDCKLKKFINSNDTRTLESLLNKYNIIEETDIILDLLKGMLTISPNQRFTVDKCLSHKFFSNLNEN
jgi:serine/threonine protein kinase